MTKKNAFLIHLAGSTIIVGIVLLLIWFVWYPAPLFELLGAWNVIRVLISVDIVLGPALTLLLYKPGKPKLLLDMSVVLIIQLAALIYGVSVIYGERPCYMVYAVDRFEAVACSQVDSKAVIANAALPAKRWQEPLYVEARMPESIEEQNLLLEEVVFQGLPDIAERPQYWLPFSVETIARIRHKYPVLGDTAIPDVWQAEVTRLLERYGPELIIVPLTAKDNSVGLVINADTLRAVGSLPVDPWELARTSKKNAAESAAE